MNKKSTSQKGVSLLEDIRKTSIKKIREQSVIDTIIDLRANKYSVLDSLGLHEMKAEMSEVGKSCQKILKMAEKLARHQFGDKDKALRIAMAKVLGWSAPAEIAGVFPKPGKCLVFGFNHPTLGEIFRMIGICITEYPNRRYLFPVNIVWYEELAPMAARMEKFGLYIVPTITPATRQKMAEKLDDTRLELVDYLAEGFNKSYLNACAECVESKDIIMIAPSATRQRTVFKSFEAFQGRERIRPQTMTILARELKRRNKLDCFFVPVAVVPPFDGDNGLNQFKPYRISACSWISPEAINRLIKSRNSETNERKLEHYFLEQITDELSELNADYLIYPY